MRMFFLAADVSFVQFRGCLQLPQLLYHSRSTKGLQISIQTDTIDLCNVRDNHRLCDESYSASPEESAREGGVAVAQGPACAAPFFILKEGTEDTREVHTS